jgi:hypothetical protein
MAHRAVRLESLSRIRCLSRTDLFPSPGLRMRREREVRFSVLMKLVDELLSGLDVLVEQLRPLGQNIPALLHRFTLVSIFDCGVVERCLGFFDARFATAAEPLAFSVGDFSFERAATVTNNDGAVTLEAPERVDGDGVFAAYSYWNSSPMARKKRGIEVM